MSEHGVPDSRLTVIKQAEDYIDKTGHHRARYLCSCSCGSGKAVLAFPSDLRRGETKSCGCRTKEINSQKQKKYNIYDLTGEFGIGYCSNTGSPFYFDLADYDLIKDYCWMEVVYGKSQYHELRTTIIVNKTKKQIRMHQLLCGGQRDHADRNPLNNRRSNLRLASVKENNRNRTVFQNNTSGIMGVSYEANRTSQNKWTARLYFEGKRYWLGAYEKKRRRN